MTLVVKRRAELVTERAVSKSKFKPRVLHYFREVERSRKPLTITDRGRPVLRIVPYEESPEAALKVLRGSVLLFEDPLAPVGVEDWEALR